MWLIDGIKYNLLSISQFCDNDCKVDFQDNTCATLDKRNGKPIFSARRKGNVYVLYLDIFITNYVKCLFVYKNDGYLRHRRLGHVGMGMLKRLSPQDLMRGLPKLCFVKT